eukprot:COSAG06_NODE_4446_length_4255_cov_3.276227_2_plen_322_part_00
MAVVESLLIYQLRKRKAVKEAVAGAFRLNSSNGGGSSSGSNATSTTRHSSVVASGVEGVASTRGVGLFKQRVVAVQPSPLAAGGGGGAGGGSGSDSLGLARRMAGGGHSGEPALPEQQPNGLAASGPSFVVGGPGAKYTVQSSSTAAQGQTVSDASMQQQRQQQQQQQVQQQPGSARAGSVSSGLPSAGTSLDLDEVVNSYGLDVHMGMEAMSTTPAPSPPAGGAGGGGEEEGGQGAADFDGNAGGGGAGNSAATGGLLSDNSSSGSDRSRKWLCGPRRGAAAAGGGGGGGAVEWLTEHLDSVSLVVFPVSYAIVTAMLFA